MSYTPMFYKVKHWGVGMTYESETVMPVETGIQDSLVS